MNKNTNTIFTHRRSLLKYLASSPLFCSAILGSLTGSLSAKDNTALLKADIERLIKTTDEAINLFDFQRVASHSIPTSHYGYLTTGVDDDVTKNSNHESYSNYYLRPRRLIDVRKIDTGIELFGEHYASPIFLSPVASQKAFHADGELATARAVRKMNFPMLLSTITSTSIEEVNAALGRPAIYQLYPTPRWNITKQILRRVEAAGTGVVVLTVDVPISNRETFKRLVRQDDRDCSACHQGIDEDLSRKPMFRGTGMSGMADMDLMFIDWDFVKRLKDETNMKLVLKGIVTWEDAELCLKNGIDGIVVSNHGGRAEESGRGTIDSLAEIMPIIGNKIPVLIDGGVRRGTDVFKALAMGASAVGIGRPYLWGLGSFGQPGVEKVLELLQKELEITMQLAGATSIEKIQRSHIGIS
ncbi:MAG: alpha-hydroxy-acid oxidizing protein [Gammaproteobacteria bacterium]|nr:alpha-hydroxy-acid oxidizing protein [Gammaproteobacteria bacterium]